MADQTPYYQELARAVTTVCGPAFRRGEIVASLNAGYAEIAYHCDGPSGRREGVASPFDVDRTVSKALHRLRETMPGKGQWSTCIFVLSADGSFQFDVGYDD